MEEQFLKFPKENVIFTITGHVISKGQATKKPCGEVFLLTVVSMVKHEL